MKAVVEGLEDYLRNVARYNVSSASVYQENKNNIVYYSDADHPVCNGVLERDMNAEIKDSDIEKVIELFKKWNRPFCWWTSAKNLEKKGFQYGGVMRGVAFDISEGLPSSPVHAEKLSIRAAENKDQLRKFCELCISVFGMSSHMLELYEKMCTATSKNGEQIHYLAYLKDTPVAVSTLILSKQSAGIWNAATLEQYRNLGIFSSLVYNALSEAKKRKYKKATALIMPKGMAWGVFQKFGFKEVGDFPFYLYGSDPNSLEQ